MSDWIIPDLDVDCNNEALEVLKNELHLIPAAKIENNHITKHLVGGYPMNIPTDPLTEWASIDYKKAEKNFGYFKLDILHNKLYDAFENRDVMIQMLKEPCKWEMLKNENISKYIPHLQKYIELLQEVNIESIEELAMFIAVIRPAKRYLIPDLLRQGWEAIEKNIWKKEENEEEEYQFKKSHAFGYAVMISLCLH